MATRHVFNWVLVNDKGQYWDGTSWVTDFHSAQVIRRNPENIVGVAQEVPGAVRADPVRKEVPRWERDPTATARVIEQTTE